MKRLPIAGLSFALFLGGCNTIDRNWLPKMPWSAAKVEDSQFQTPKHMAAIWSADVLTQLGKPPVRGFGGRFYFYNAQNQPIPVEGQLVVYAYDDTQMVHTQGRQPDRKFAFTPEQFTQHYSPSAIGASYSIWVPWDEAGGDQRSISLVPVFTATSGQIVMGQQALTVLPGKHPELAQQRPMQRGFRDGTAVAQRGGVQPAGHYASAALPAVREEIPRPNLNTTTIELPSTMRKRLKAAAAAEALQAVDGTNPSASPAPATGSPVSGHPAVYPYTTAYSPGQLPQPSAMPPLPPASSPPAHYAHPTLPAPREPSEQSGRAGFGWRRHPAAPQFAHPSAPEYPTPTQVQEYGAPAVPSVR